MIRCKRGHCGSRKSKRTIIRRERKENKSSEGLPDTQLAVGIAVNKQDRKSSHGGDDRWVGRFNFIPWTRLLSFLKFSSAGCFAMQCDLCVTGTMETYGGPYRNLLYLVRCTHGHTLAHLVPSKSQCVSLWVFVLFVAVVCTLAAAVTSSVQFAASPSTSSHPLEHHGIKVERTSTETGVGLASIGYDIVRVCCWSTSSDRAISASRTLLSRPLPQLLAVS